jgi:ABC-type transporter Mla subunit MlaD
MSTEAKVGLFVILSAALLIATVYYVGNAQWGHHVIPYRTYLRYAGGVEPGSEVLFGGIAAGRVTTVRAWNEDPTRIEILLELKGTYSRECELHSEIGRGKSHEQPCHLDYDRHKRCAAPQAGRCDRV